MVFLATAEEMIIRAAGRTSVNRMYVNRIWIVIPGNGPRPTDWKSVIPIILERQGLSTPSVDRDIEEKSYNVHKVSVSGCCFEPKVVVTRKVAHAYTK